MNNISKSNLLLFAVLCIVFVINIIQGGVTELLADEAYYWVYKEHLDWGFFDHPPAVAVWIYLSDLFFSGEMGVRFFSAISYSATLLFVWKAIDHPKKQAHTWLFLMVFLSSVLLSVYGFITTPDTPLMLFYAIFIYAYQQYLKHQSVLSYLLLSVSIAGMMYSKYQGILIVFFVILSNLKLIRDPKLWLSSLLAFILYTPHLYWLWANDFPSIKYHLVERGNRVYKFEHTLLHFVNVIAIVGMTFPIVYRAFFSYQNTKNVFARALNFIVWGFIIFFFLSTFKGHVQAQWVLAIAIPLGILTFWYLIDHPQSRTWFIALACVNFLFMIVARVQLVTPVLPLNMETHGNEKWTHALKLKTEGQQKVFVNSYRHTAAYWFYTGEPAFYLRNYSGRNTHFQLLQKNTDLSSKEVALVRKVRENPTDVGVQTRQRDSVFAEIVYNFKDLAHITMTLSSDDILLKKGSNTFPIQIESSFHRTVSLDEFEVVIGFEGLDKSQRYEIESTIVSEQKSLQKNKPLTALITFDTAKIRDPEMYPFLGIGLRNSDQVDLVLASHKHRYGLEGSFESFKTNPNEPEPGL
ncbi:MAG: glycosyltransferase family 39 protein [Flavobacteriales bacterium]|nr:glycosyltransferase family 39 protein [Flavobacteriales bacterium]